MIRALGDFSDPATALGLLYSGIAAAVSAGVVLGVAVVWISTAVRGTDAS